MKANDNARPTRISLINCGCDVLYSYVLEYFSCVLVCRWKTLGTRLVYVTIFVSVLVCTCVYSYATRMDSFALVCYPYVTRMYTYDVKFIWNNSDIWTICTLMLLVCTRSESKEGLTLETSAPWSLYGGQFTLSTQLKKPNYLTLTAFRYKSRNLRCLDIVFCGPYQAFSISLFKQSS